MQPLLRRQCELGNEESVGTCLANAMHRVADGMHYG